MDIDDIRQGFGILDLAVWQFSKIGGDADAPIQFFSGSIQILLPSTRFDWKTKYFPSGVQLPQHSAVGRVQFGNRGRSLFPANANSHSDVARVAESTTVNRKREPSGEQRSQNALPGTDVKTRALCPSLRVIRIFCPEA